MIDEDQDGEPLDKTTAAAMQQFIEAIKELGEAFVEVGYSSEETAALIKQLVDSIEQAGCPDSPLARIRCWLACALAWLTGWLARVRAWLAKDY